MSVRRRPADVMNDLFAAAAEYGAVSHKYYNSNRARVLKKRAIKQLYKTAQAYHQCIMGRHLAGYRKVKPVFRTQPPAIR